MPRSRKCIISLFFFLVYKCYRVRLNIIDSQTRIEKEREKESKARILPSVDEIPDVDKERFSLILNA